MLTGELGEPLDRMEQRQVGGGPPLLSESLCFMNYMAITIATVVFLNWCGRQFG